MKKAKISLIAAIGSGRELGKNNQLLWHIPDDLKRFKKITAGHPVIMGRKTYESLGRPLPHRVNIVISRDKNYQAQGANIVDSLEKALDFAQSKDDKEIFIIGGGQIYHQAIERADKLYLTIVEGNFEADTFFPDYADFKKITFKQCGKYSNYKYTFLELER